jgi:hypothetical protein
LTIVNFNTLLETGIDPFSLFSWTELFNLAQEKSLSLLIAQTEMIFEEKKILQFYHGTYLYSYATKKIEDPLTKLPIKKIHYFILDTFKLNKKQLVKMSLQESLKKAFEITSFTEGLNEEDKEIFFDSFNVLAANKSVALYKQIKKCQFLVATWIQTWIQKKSL